MNDKTDMEMRIIDEIQWANKMVIEICKETPQLIDPNTSMLDLIKFVLERKDAKKK